MSPYRLVFGKLCHLPVAIEYKAYWAIKKCNWEMTEAGIERKLRLQELEEFQLEAYENSKLYKERTKKVHDKLIQRKEFIVGQKVLLFNSRLRLMPGKLKSRWTGPFKILNIFPNGVFEIQSFQTNQIFKVNGYRIKPYLENINISETVEEVSLIHPIYE
jgi:hypothetical protein